MLAVPSVATMQPSFVDVAQTVEIVFLSGDIFKEKLSKVLDVPTTRHTTPASTATATASTEVVDIFDDPLNASDV